MDAVKLLPRLATFLPLFTHGMVEGWLRVLNIESFAVMLFVDGMFLGAEKLQGFENLLDLSRYL